MPIERPLERRARIRKPRAFWLWKVTTESNRSENQNNKQQAIIVTEKQRLTKSTKVARLKLMKNFKNVGPDKFSLMLFTFNSRFQLDISSFYLILLSSFYLFIVRKSLTTETFFQVWKGKIIWGSWISSHNARCWVFFPCLDNQWKLSHVHPKKLMPWSCQQMELSLPSIEPILPFQSIGLTVPSSQVWSDGPMFHPCLWIDAKNLLCCFETSPNTRLKLSHGAVFVPLWANVAPKFVHCFFMSKSSVNMRYIALF